MGGHNLVRDKLVPVPYHLVARTRGPSHHTAEHLKGKTKPPILSMLVHLPEAEQGDYKF